MGFRNGFGASILEFTNLGTFSQLGSTKYFKNSLLITSKTRNIKNWRPRLRQKNENSKISRLVIKHECSTFINHLGTKSALRQKEIRVFYQIGGSGSRAKTTKTSRKKQLFFNRSSAIELEVKTMFWSLINIWFLL